MECFSDIFLNKSRKFLDFYGQYQKEIQNWLIILAKEYTKLGNLIKTSPIYYLIRSYW